MTDHLRRIREHMALEARGLKLQAERARLFDNTTNRGSEAEHSVRRWLGARFSPDYAISSGEIIDSFDTNAELNTRQQDGILHTNSADANRFLLPSGMRLVPVETVAAVIEVKLSLDKEEFDKAERAAKETARLRLRAHRNSDFPRFDGSGAVGPAVTEDQRQEGVCITDPAFGRASVTFAIFAFEGPLKLETIRGWMGGTTISVVCCLTSGCTARDAPMPVNGFPISSPGGSSDAGPEDALWHFAEMIGRVTAQHRHLLRSFHPDFNGYAPYPKTLTVSTTVVRPPGAQPEEDLKKV